MKALTLTSLARAEPIARSSSTTDAMPVCLTRSRSLAFQAPWCSPRVRNPVKVGMKAEASAPPATRLKSRSGIRAAALKASISGPVPKAPETSTWRIRPVRLLKIKAAITVPAARAIWRLAVSVTVFTRTDYIRGRIILIFLKALDIEHVFDYIRAD